MTLSGQPAASAAQAPDPIRYTLRFPAPHTHYVEVEATLSDRRRGRRSSCSWRSGRLGPIWCASTSATSKTSLRRAPAGARDRSSSRQEPLARGRPAAPRRVTRDLSRLRPRNDRPQQLDRERLRDAQRRADVHLAGRRHRAPHEVRIELPAAWKGVATALMPGRGQPHTLSRRGLRHARRQPDHRRQPGDSRSSRSAARSTTSCSKATRRFFDADRAAADVQKIVEAGGAVMGPLRLSALLLSQPGHRSRRRPRAQEQLPGHVGPLHDPHATRLSRLARPASRTSTSTTGTSSGCGRSSSARSTTRTRCTPRRCGSAKASPITTPVLLVKRGGALARATSISRS